MNDNNAECGQALPYTLEDLPQVIELCLSTEHHGLVRMLSEIKADADRRLSAQQPAAPAVPDDVDLWAFCRDVLKRGAAIESQFAQQGYETFIAEIEHAARKEDKRLRALLSAQQPATPAVPRKTNRELHESAAGMNLSDSFFSHSGIDPDGYPPDSVTAPAVPDGFALVEVAVIDDEWLAVAMRDADIVRRVCADDSVVISAAINAYLLAASRKDAAQKPAPANGDGQ